MADGQAFNYRALYRRLRPARVATFLSASSPRWEHDALRMLENYSLTWGGSLDVLAPFRTDGSVHPVLWRLVELFDADHVATYTETRRGLRLADPAEFERWLDREVTAWIERYGGDRVEVERLLQRDNLLDHAEPWDPPEALTNRLVRRTAPIIERDKLRWTRFRPDASTAHGLVDVLHLNDLPDRIVNVSTDALPMWARLVVAARFGHLGSRQAEGLLGRGVAIEQIDASPSDLDLLLRWAWFGNQDWLLAVVGRMTGTTNEDRVALERTDLLDRAVLRLSETGLRQMRRLSADEYEFPVTVVVGSGIEDFCLALLLDRAGTPSIWVPNEVLAEEGAPLEVLCSGLRDLHHGSQDRTVALTSMTEPSAALESAAARLSANRWQVETVITPVPRLPEEWIVGLLDPAHFADPLDELFDGPAMARGLPAVTPTATTASDNWKLQWFTEVESPAFALPPRSALNSLAISGEAVWPTKARIGRTGISFASHSMGFVAAGTPLESMINRPRLQFPDARQVFDQLFGKAQLRLEESAAGRFQRLSTELWGGFRAFHLDLLDARRHALLQAFLSTRQSGPDPGVWIKKGHRVLSFEDAGAATGLLDDDLRGLLDHYLDRSIIERGYVLKCPVCLATDWYRLDSIGRTFDCTRCTRAQTLTRRTWFTNTPEPTPYYDLAPVVVQAIEHHADVTIRALGQLGAGADPVVYLSDQNVHPTTPQFEIDILAVANRRIVLGEAKTAPKLDSSATKEDRWLRVFKQMAQAITADEVVFATAAPAWNAATLGRIHAYFPIEGDIAPRLLTDCGATATPH